MTRVKGAEQIAQWPMEVREQRPAGQGACLGPHGHNIQMSPASPCKPVLSVLEGSFTEVQHKVSSY